MAKEREVTADVSADQSDWTAVNGMTKPDAALWYAAHGFPVFPCLPFQKEPATTNGHKDASTDEATIRAWWKQNPNYNIGFSPGHVGMGVLDTDPPKGEETLAGLELEHGFLSATLEQSTPRGGRHRLFKNVRWQSSVGTDKNGLGPKLDTRSYGGYIVLAPSCVRYEDGHEGSYAWTNSAPIADGPPWIADALARKREEHKAADVALDLPANISRAESLCARYVENGDVAVEGRGGDERTYRLACEVLNLGVSPAKGFDIIKRVWNPACEPPWGDDELAAKVRNAAEYSQNDMGAWAAGSGDDTFASFVAAQPDAPHTDEERKRRRETYKYALRNPHEDAYAPSPKFRDTFRPEGKRLWMSHRDGIATLVAGAPKAGKTNIVLADKFRLMLSGSARVLYGALEGGFENGNERIPTLVKFYAKELTALCGSDKFDDHLAYIAAGRFLQSRMPFFALDDEESVVAFVEFLQDAGERFGLGGFTDFVIDTQRRGSGGLDENSAKDMNRLWRSLFFIQEHVTYRAEDGERRHCNFTDISHVGKDVARGVAGNLAQVGHASQVFTITRDRDAGTSQLTVSERRGGRDGFSVFFRHEELPDDPRPIDQRWPVPVPMDEDEAAREIERRRVKPKKGDPLATQGAVQNALIALGAMRDGPRAYTPKTMRGGVSVEELRDKLVELERLEEDEWAGGSVSEPSDIEIARATKRSASLLRTLNRQAASDRPLADFRHPAPPEAGTKAPMRWAIVGEIRGGTDA